MGFNSAFKGLIAINRQNCERLTNNGRCTFPNFTAFSIQLQQMLFAVLGLSKTVMFGAQFSLAMNIRCVLHICICLAYMRDFCDRQILLPIKSHYISITQSYSQKKLLKSDKPEQLYRHHHHVHEGLAVFPVP